jgi:predicted nuclease of predicted toxin-antitoxin system
VKLLFDEMMPDELAPLLVGHEVSHVNDLGWRHITNGELLTLSETEGFEVLITKDANLPYQQNLTGRRIALLILRPEAQSLPALLALASEILRALSALKPGSVVRVTGS